MKFPSYRIKTRERFKGVTLPEGFKTRLAREIVRKNIGRRDIDPNGFAMATVIMEGASPQAVKRMVRDFNSGRDLLR